MRGLFRMALATVTRRWRRSVLASAPRGGSNLRRGWLLLQHLQMKHAAGHSIWLLARFLGPLAGPENTNPCVGGLVDRKLLRLVAQITADRFDADRGRLRWARGRFRWAQRLCRRRHLPQLGRLFGEL